MTFKVQLLTVLTLLSPSLFASRSVAPSLGIFSVETSPTCTATCISPQGHMLLAQHCFDSVRGGLVTEENLDSRIKNQLARLQKQASTETEQISTAKVVMSEHNELFSTVSVMGMGNRKMSLLTATFFNYTNNVSKDLKMNGEDHKTEFIAMGDTVKPRFNFETHVDKLQNIYDELSANGAGRSSDFAVIKAPSLCRSASQCYLFSESHPATEDELVAASFNCHPDPKKEWPYIRKGKPLGDSIEGVLKTSLPVEECNSGSSVMNSSGQIVGILVEGRDHRSGVLPLQTILSSLPSKTRKTIVDLNRSCINSKLRNVDSQQEGKCHHKAAEDLSQIATINNEGFEWLPTGGEIKERRKIGKGHYYVRSKGINARVHVYTSGNKIVGYQSPKFNCSELQVDSSDSRNRQSEGSNTNPAAATR